MRGAIDILLSRVSRKNATRKNASLALSRERERDNNPTRAPAPWVKEGNSTFLSNLRLIARVTLHVAISRSGGCFLLPRGARSNCLRTSLIRKRSRACVSAAGRLENNLTIRRAREREYLKTAPEFILGAEARDYPTASIVRGARGRAEESVCVILMEIYWLLYAEFEMRG